MLGFIVFCLFFAVFALPLTIFSFRSRNKEFRQENWGGKLKLRIGWLAFGIVLFMVMEVVFRYWIEASWFEELGQLDRFWTVFFTKLNYFLIGGGVIFTLYLANLLIAHKTIAKHLTEIREATGLAWVSSKNIPRQSHWIVAIIAGIANGIVCSSAWEKILLYYSGQEFGILDPVFSQDVSFYVFSLPFYQFMVDFLFYLFFFTLLILAIYYLTVWYLLKDSLAYHDRKNPEAAWKSLNRLGNRGITHLAIVGIFVLLAMAANTRISIWEVLFSTRGA
ncbi:MAG: UPF0182 family protein, partial [Planctomycetes bacterium]|nr:UPF0182 family protein [Planctomycetota bacterium]